MTASPLNGWVGWSLDDWSTTFDLLDARLHRDRARLCGMVVDAAASGDDFAAVAEMVSSLVEVVLIAFKQDCALLGVDPAEHLAARRAALARQRAQAMN